MNEPDEWSEIETQNQPAGKHVSRALTMTVVAEWTESSALSLNTLHSFCETNPR